MARRVFGRSPLPTDGLAMMAPVPIPSVAIPLPAPAAAPIDGNPVGSDPVGGNPAGGNPAPGCPAANLDGSAVVPAPAPVPTPAADTNSSDLIAPIDGDGSLALRPAQVGC